MTGEMPLDLITAVDRLIAGPVTGIGDVRREPLEYDAFLAGRSLARVRGTVLLDSAAETRGLTRGRPEPNPSA